MFRKQLTSATNQHVQLSTSSTTPSRWSATGLHRVAPLSSRREMSSMAPSEIATVVKPPTSLTCGRLAPWTQGPDRRTVKILSGVNDPLAVAQNGIVSAPEPSCCAHDARATPSNRCRSTRHLTTQPSVHRVQPSWRETPPHPAVRDRSSTCLPCRGW